MLLLRNKVDLEVMVLKGYSVLHKAPILRKLHHQIVQCQNQDFHWGALLSCRDAFIVFCCLSQLGQDLLESRHQIVLCQNQDTHQGSLTLLQKCSHCILLPQPTGPRFTGVSTLDCFVSKPGHSLGEPYSSAEMQSLYSAALADWAKIYWSLDIRLFCVKTRTLIRGALLFCRNAVIVFCCLSQLGQDLLESRHQIVLCQNQDTHQGSLTLLQKCSHCILLPQPTGPRFTGASSSHYLVSKQDIRWGSFNLLQRCSHCILQPQPTGPRFTGVSTFDCFVSKSGHSLGEPYSSAVMTSLYSVASADWDKIYWSLGIRLFSVKIRTLTGGFLLFCVDAIAVFCDPSWLDQEILDIIKLCKLFLFDKNT